MLLIAACTVDECSSEVVVRSLLNLPSQLCSADTRSKSGFVELMQLCESADSLGRRLITAVKSLIHTDTSAVSTKCEHICVFDFCFLYVP